MRRHFWERTAFAIVAVASVAFGFSKFNQTNLDVMERWLTLAIALMLALVFLGAAFARRDED